uniref:Uncharacterized protein n=1 Tax=Vespula pensylvanica TaxID=30213 RepID=A0A834P2A9_VESPE|nr:hypothetical protein H0235_008020 [Vespula pensylvanica]
MENVWFSQQVDDESAGNRTPKLVARISILRALDARLEDEASSRKELDPPKRGRRMIPLHCTPLIWDITAKMGSYVFIDRVLNLLIEL